MRYSLVLGLAGMALTAPIVDDHAAIVDLTTTMVFDKTLEEFKAWRAEGKAPVELMVNTEGCPMGKGQIGQQLQDACHRREFALKAYEKQGRLTKDNKKQINLRFRFDLADLCPGPFLGFPCEDEVKIYYQTIRAYGKNRAANIMARYPDETEILAGNKEKMPCDKAREAVQNGNATMADLEEVKLCDFLEDAYNHHPMPNKTSVVLKRAKGRTCLGGDPTGPDILGKLRKRGDMTGSDSDLEPCNTSVGSFDSHGDYDIWMAETSQPGKTPEADGHYKREDMSGSSSDFLPGHTSFGSEASHDTHGDDEYALTIRHTNHHIEESSENGNGSVETPAKSLRRRMHDPRCQEDGWGKRGDMTGSDSDFEPCGTSVGSIESGNDWSTWEAEHIPDTATASPTPTTQHKQHAGAVLRRLIKDPRGNPHVHGERQKMLEKYCGTLQYDVEVWGNGEDDNEGDGIEEHIMMDACKSLGYYKEHDHQINGPDDKSDPGMTTDDEACPSTEDCEGLSGSEYDTTESDADHPAPVKRDFIDQVEPMRKEYEELMFKTDLREFMDRLPMAVEKFTGCANLTASENGWNFHDSCVRHEYGYYERWLIRNESADMEQEDIKANARVNEVFKQDLDQECRFHNMAKNDGVTPIQAACHQIAKLYHMIVAQVGARSAAPMFDTLQKTILQGAPPIHLPQSRQ